MRKPIADSAVAARAVPSGKLPGVVVLTLIGGLIAAPGYTVAQSSSSLYAVGERSVRAKPIAAPKLATSDSATAASTTPKAGSARSGTSASRTSTATSRKAAPNAAKGKPSGSKSAASGKTRSRNVARVSAPSPIALNGRWHDSQCIPLTGITHNPPLYVKRQYEFVDARKTWKLDAAVYTSDSCVVNTRLLTYHGEGTFAVTGKSKVAGNAYDASFKFARWSATPATREGVLTLLNGRCGSGDFAEGVRLDLSATGCPILGIRSLERSPHEVELVAISNGKFFLGSRSFVPGLNDERPEQLSSYGLSRIP